MGERWVPPPATYEYEVRETGWWWNRYAVHFHHGVAFLPNALRFAHTEERAHRKGKRMIAKFQRHDEKHDFS